ncbi:GFA family protein [Oceaniradius stylonematis]|uniref:GFA family protein n=1 Tax=Oceaniradius stylonematis TaxID=2184161 RepID=A0A3A8A781_9HYPH|nr:GFA family protein [Oceaniradius stylonematis]RKF06055.1 GFA family protein [Oceaniradius stylonematis]
MSHAFHQRGGCQCGAIRYTLTERPRAVYCCHCIECQRQSSSAFGISVRVRRAALSVEGETAKFNKTSGDRLTICEFCPHCGSRLFHNRPAHEDLLTIKGGTFDDTSWLKPVGHIWLKSKQAWVLIPEDGLRFDAQPDDYDVLSVRYAEQWGPPGRE